MAGKTLSYFNLTGGLNTVQAMATINSTTNRTESPDMVNVEYFKLSGLKTMNGNVGLNHSNPLTDSSEYQRINFGYEYIKGDTRYMIVANRRNLYEYNPSNDTFTLLNASIDPSVDYTFATAGDGITICGFANGIVAASPKNDYLVYYRKDRYTGSLGTVTATASSDTITLTSTVIDMLGKGDIITINDVKYEIDSVNLDDNEITLTEAVSTSYTGDKIELTDFTKIPCVYTSITQDGNDTQTVTHNFTPRVIQSHQGRLWVAASIDDEDVAAYLIYSDLGNIHNAFEGGDASAYDAGYFEEFWEDTSDITALGTWDKYVVVHKREHTYLINTSNSDATSWNVESYSDYTCSNQQGFVKANNGYYTFCQSAGGIYPMIQRTIYSAISQGNDASIKIRDSFLNINTYALNEIYAVYHPFKKYIMFYMPMIGEGSSNNCYILDLQTKSWLHRRVPQKVCTAFEFDNKVYIGTTDGKIFEEFRGLDFDGEPIPFSWKSPWFIWGNGTNWTTTREIRVKMSQEGTNNFFIRNRRDGDERYKERVMTNTSSKVNALVWDDKYLTNDKTAGYAESTPVYSYTFHGGYDDEVTYYSLDSVITRYSLMFSELPTTMSIIGGIPAGALGRLTELTEEQVRNGAYFDTVIPGNDTAYAFIYRPTQPQYKCYRSSKDSNIKAWVPYNDTTKAMVNVTDQNIENKYLAFNFKKFNLDQYDTVYVTQADYDSKWYTPSARIPAYLNSNGNLTHSWTNNSTVWVSNWYEARQLDVWRSGRVVVAQIGSTAVTIGDSLHRDSSKDKVINTGVKEVWNGKSTRSGKTKTVSRYSTSSITIDGVTYNRYSAGDEGTVEDPSQAVDYVYGKTPTLTKGQKVYQNNLTTEKGTVSAVSGTNYTINGKVYTPDQSKNEYGLGSRWFVTSRMFNDNAVGNDTGQVATASYLFPTGDTEMLSDGTKLLTDSKWDGNKEINLTINGNTYYYQASENDPNQHYTKPDTQASWINSGQVTKRFPIDRQYFQTLQLEFCGEAINQGIELYGFEVDGIQLTEVPW